MVNLGKCSSALEENNCLPLLGTVFSLHIIKWVNFVPLIVHIFYILIAFWSAGFITYWKVC